MPLTRKPNSRFLPPFFVLGSCSVTVCGDDRRCVVRGGEERCVCSPKCYLKNKSPVCGSDGRTYRSECHLLKRACRKKRRLLVKHYGSCQTNPRPPPRLSLLPPFLPPPPRLFLLLLVSPSSSPSLPPPPRLSLPFSLSSTFPPYSPFPVYSFFSLFLTLLIPSACSGVKCRPGKSCVLGEDLVPRCRRCPPHCVPRSPRRPVCAADGNTYLSACHLKTAACEAGRVIVKSYRGPCQANATCSTVRCWRGQRCLTHHVTGVPQCYACNSRAECRTSSGLRQVCGADGRKYSSMCAVMHESCRTGRALAAVPRSFCNESKF
ncbi:Kazal domain [Trinorchestia longiramus]|nr:Kazal domain [Trinorchestia longiramus]